MSPKDADGMACQAVLAQIRLLHQDISVQELRIITIYNVVLLKTADRLTCMVQISKHLLYILLFTQSANNFSMRLLIAWCLYYQLAGWLIWLHILSNC